MGESIRVMAKRPEAAKDKKASQTRRSDSVQPVNSPVDRILFLQRTIGNQAVQRLIKSGALQAKLRINQPGDIYEQEADKVSEQVMRMPLNPEDKGCERKRNCPKYAQIRRRPWEDMLRIQRDSGNPAEIMPDIETKINSLKGGGQPLPDSILSFFKPRFGYNFANVRIHTDFRAIESAKAVNALAYTVGQRHIVFGAGQYKPDTAAGKKLIAHELTHVVQQQVSGNSSTQRQEATPETTDLTRTAQIPISREEAETLSPDLIFQKINLVKLALQNASLSDADRSILQQNLTNLQAVVNIVCLRREGGLAKGVAPNDIAYMALDTNIVATYASFILAKFEEIDSATIVSCEALEQLAVEQALSEAGATYPGTPSIAKVGTQEHQWLDAYINGQKDILAQATIGQVSGYMEAIKILGLILLPPVVGFLPWDSEEKEEEEEEGIRVLEGGAGGAGGDVAEDEEIVEEVEQGYSGARGAGGSEPEEELEEELLEKREKGAEAINEVSETVIITPMAAGVMLSLSEGSALPAGAIQGGTLAEEAVRIAVRGATISIPPVLLPILLVSGIVVLAMVAAPKKKATTRRRTRRRRRKKNMCCCHCLLVEGSKKVHPSVYKRFRWGTKTKYGCKRVCWAHAAEAYKKDWPGGFSETPVIIPYCIKMKGDCKSGRPKTAM